jgi:TnpA family transposase
LVAAIILWNTKYLEVAYTELRRQGGTINEDLLRHSRRSAESTLG